MGKKLAIKGHPTRGKEVIELLEMMGGINPFSINDGRVIGNRETSCYYISEDIAKGYISWDYIGPEEIDKYEIFTLEEFLEKYPFKVGDKVTLNNKLCTIIWMCWECNNIYYHVQETDGMFVKKVTANELKPYKGEEDMETKDKAKAPVLKGTDYGTTDHGYTIPDGYEFVEVREDFVGRSEIVLRKKSPVYPKTLGDCCKVIVDIGDYQMCGYKHELLFNFQNLLICRDAYWKIAGEEMGLGKPWEPDWNDLNRKYFISLTCDGIGFYDDFRNPQVLAFPTEEMRDAFYENFKDLIEQCKELL